MTTAGLAGLEKFDNSIPFTALKYVKSVLSAWPLLKLPCDPCRLMDLSVPDILLGLKPPLE